MIEIPEPPDKQFCASCSSALSWLWSSKRQAWVAIVSAGTPDAYKLHPCQHAQDPGTWRSLPRGEPPNVEYLAAKQKIKSAPKETA